MSEVLNYGVIQHTETLKTYDYTFLIQRQRLAIAFAIVTVRFSRSRQTVQN